MDPPAVARTAELTRAGRAREIVAVTALIWIGSDLTVHMLLDPYLSRGYFHCSIVEAASVSRSGFRRSRGLFWVMAPREQKVLSRQRRPPGELTNNTIKGVP